MILDEIIRDKKELRTCIQVEKSHFQEIVQESFNFFTGREFSDNRKELWLFQQFSYDESCLTNP